MCCFTRWHCMCGTGLCVYSTGSTFPAAEARCFLSPRCWWNLARFSCCAASTLYSGGKPSSVHSCDYRCEHTLFFILSKVNEVGQISFLHLSSLSKSQLELDHSDYFDCSRANSIWQWGKKVALCEHVILSISCHLFTLNHWIQLNFLTRLQYKSVNL